MTFQYPAPGINDVASYMVAGLPWVSSSTLTSGSTWRIDFPYITSEIQVHNATPGLSSIGVAFTQSGALGTNRFIVGTNTTSGNTFAGETFSFRAKIKTLYIVALTGSCTVSVYAGLTTILTRSFPTLTESSPLAFNNTSSLYDPYLSYGGLG